MRKLLVLTFVFLVPPVFAQNTISSEEKDKIFFMLLEAQARKLTPTRTSQCVSPEEKKTWHCQNPTVKKFIMNIFRLKSEKESSLVSSLKCQTITKDLQKSVMENSTSLEFGGVVFRREISQALKDQWLCFLKIEQKLLSGTESFDDPTVLLSSQSQPTIASGLSFIMNRDKSRIVSKNISSWWVVQ